MNVMKTIVRLCAFFLALALSSACVREEQVGSAAVELTARLEYDAETRTTLSGLENGMYYPLWSAGDEIAVFVDGASTPSRFKLQSGEGSTVASFAGTEEGERYVALYPYDMAESLSDGTLTLTLPQTQEYLPDSFGQGSFPMIATGGSDGSLKFMNLCSVLKISFTGTAAIRNVKLTANDENTFLSGPASVAADYTASPNDIMSVSADGSSSVVLECNGLEISEDSPADVFIVIPSQTYKGGFTIEVDTYTDTLKTNITSDITFDRSQIRAIRELALDSEAPDIIPEAIPDDEIWYTTIDDRIFGDYSLYESLIGGAPFDRSIVDHKYENGLGVIRFDGPVSVVGDYAFAAANFPGWQLKSIYLPDGIRSLGEFAFLLQENIEVFKVPESIEEINHSFRGTKIKTFIGDNLFGDGEGILVDGVLYTLNYDEDAEELIIPSNVNEVAALLTGGFSDFSNRPNIKSLYISEGVRYIGNSAFQNCSRLETIHVPESLEDVGTYLFRGCPDIRTFSGSHEWISADGKLMYDYMVVDGVSSPCVSIAAKVDLPVDYVIPEGVVSIRPCAFENCLELRSVTLPGSLLMIEAGGEVFRNCPDFEFIYGNYASPDNKCAIVHNRFWCDGKYLHAFAGKNVTEYTTSGITAIGDMVFAYQNTVENVIINDEVISIGNHCFAYSPSLKSVTLPAGLETVRNDPFVGSDNLEAVYFRSPVPPRFEIGGIEQSHYDNLTIYVPEQSLELYLEDSSWAPLREYMVGCQYDDLPDDDHYRSSDYSADGLVEMLQSASVGNGINVVLLGDGYSDRQIADGTYKADMEFVYRNLFTEEPYDSYRNLFNVSYVNVVSATEGFEYGDTALGCQFGGGTYVYGRDGKCFDYARNIVEEDDMDEVLVVVVMNSDSYAGTCYMYNPIDRSRDYGSGAAVAYFPKGVDEEMFAQLLHHEACGHGFAKLADEYYFDGTTIPDSEISNLSIQSRWGWGRNTDFTSDPTQVKWAEFLEDERYAGEGLGVFEGAHTYQFGAYRATEYSIMRYNTGGFNAPSREAIYYRIHKLAYGEDWEYDYEKFVEYDAVNRAAAAAGGPQKRRSNYVEKQYEPLHPPVVVGRTWREAR